MKLFYGTRENSGTTAGVVEANSSFLDDGAAYNMVVTTNRFAPGGDGGEAVFTTLYAVFQNREAVRVRIAILVDDTPINFPPLGAVGNPNVSYATVPYYEINLPASANFALRHYEIGLSIPLKDATGIEVARFAARGTWFQVKVETVADGTTIFLNPLLIEELEVEYENVRESR